MATSISSLTTHPRIEDVLAHLPASTTMDYATGQLIYGPNKDSKSIYLVVAGKVGTYRITEDGREVLLEIIRPEELFGESAFLDSPRHAERAVALEDAKVMTWPVSDMEDLVTKRPRLAVALLQILAQRNAEFTRRIESMAIDSVQRRLARSLLRFSDRFGTPEADGSVRMMPITHTLISQYVGTSRELVTQHMNRFRKQGYVSYSRQCIFLYRDPLTTLLKSRGFVPLKEAAASPANVPSITLDLVMSSFEQTPERSPIDNR